MVDYDAQDSYDAQDLENTDTGIRKGASKTKLEGDALKYFTT